MRVIKYLYHYGLWAVIVCPFLAGCHLPGMNAAGVAAAWDEFRCDRRVGVIANLRLNTDPGGRGSDNFTRAEDYNRALAFFHDRGVSEVIFVGRATANGSIGEFRALDAGFSSVPDPDYKQGHATVTWNVKRTYRFAPEDAMGKYHPRTFWPRVFGCAWSDDLLDHAPQQDQPVAVGLYSPPAFYLRSYYGTRCRIQQVGFVSHEEMRDGKLRTERRWEVLGEWKEE